MSQIKVKEIKMATIVSFIQPGFSNFRRIEQDLEQIILQLLRALSLLWEITHHVTERLIMIIH